jgi:hypothetical protein
VNRGATWAPKRKGLRKGVRINQPILGREGKALPALLVEGATWAPVNRRFIWQTSRHMICSNEKMPLLIALEDLRKHE